MVKSFLIFTTSYALLIGAFVVGCKKRPESSVQEVVKTGAEAVGSAAMATAGEAIVNQQCLPCHQKDGVGKVGLAPSISNRDFLAMASNDFIKNTIQKGRAGTAMIPRPDLTDEQVLSVITYLRSLPNPLPVTIKVDETLKFKGDVDKGKETFAIYCSSCHGEKGEGYASGGSGPGIGMKGFLDNASDDFIFQTVKHGRSGTSMRPFIGAKGLANLEEKDIHNVIVYLRSI